MFRLAVSLPKWFLANRRSRKVFMPDVWQVGCALNMFELSTSFANVSVQRLKN